MKKKWIFLAIYLILVIICAIIIYVVPPVAGLLERTYIAEHGNLEVANEVEALIIRDDTVYVSKAPGDVNRLVEEGALVRTGSQIVELTGEGNEELDNKYSDTLERLGKAAGKSKGGVQKPGYVTFHFDGYEGMLTPENLDEITYKQYEEISDKDIIEMPNKRCAKGEPISRITSNGSWWILFYVDKDNASRYIEGDVVNIEIGKSSVEGTIRTVTEEKKRTKVIIKCKMNCKEYLFTRKAPVKVVTSSANGIILDKESLVTINDKLGVIVIDKIGDKYFRPVKIKADDGERVAVYEDIYMDENDEFVETIDNYDEILKSPTDKDIGEIVAEMKPTEEDKK